ncbi:MAG: hypothetical protein ACXVA9_01865 [Bdellovibrionales bacterium]
MELGKIRRIAFILIALMPLIWPGFVHAKCENYLWSKNLNVEYPSLSKEKQRWVWRNGNKYVNLLQDGMSDELREAVIEARDNVKENLDWLPVIRRQGLPYMPHTGTGIKLYEPGVRPARDNSIAYYVYKIPTYDHGLLISDNMWVSPSYREMGLSELMLAEILAAHPWVDRIRVDDLFSSDAREESPNEVIFERAYKKMSCKDAIRETPAFKIFERFGFSKFVDAECDDPTGIHFTLTKSKK